jgi:hypothetical protein
VRVNVQLIDANTDEHVWANDYDRDVTDVFAIQSDLAREIANALQAKLSPAEKSQMTRSQRKTARLIWLSCRRMIFPAHGGPAKLKQSEQLYQRAVDLDPNFALALARYSQLESWMLRTHEALRNTAKKRAALAERALATTA